MTDHFMRRLRWRLLQPIRDTLGDHSEENKIHGISTSSVRSLKEITLWSQ